jgi:hypothetical protein
VLPAGNATGGGQIGNQDALFQMRLHIFGQATQEQRRERIRMNLPIDALTRLAHQDQPRQAVGRFIGKVVGKVIATRQFVGQGMDERTAATKRTVEQLPLRCRAEGQRVKVDVDWRLGADLRHAALTPAGVMNSEYALAACDWRRWPSSAPSTRAGVRLIDSRADSIAGTFTS